MAIYKLIPALKEYIWGGTKLKQYRVSDLSHIAESWELSFHKDGLSMVNIDGKIIPLIDVVKETDLGRNAKKFPFFPVLIKLIDSMDNLSVQVHPSDDYALKYENSFGKAEMWYILEAEKGAGLYVGFKKNEKLEDVKKYLYNGDIIDHLNFFKVKKGDCFFISPGTIHAIGKGVTLIEIQQNSNLTYRLFDFNRKDKNGNSRELHIEKGLKVIDTSKYVKDKHKGYVLASCKYFETCLKDAMIDDEVFIKDSFSSLTFIEGSGTINGISYSKYDSFFIPAKEKCLIKGVGKYVLTYVN